AGGADPRALRLRALVLRLDQRPLAYRKSERGAAGSDRGNEKAGARCGITDIGPGHTRSDDSGAGRALREYGDVAGTYPDGALGHGDHCSIGNAGCTSVISAGHHLARRTAASRVGPCSAVDDASAYHNGHVAVITRILVGIAAANRVGASRHGCATADRRRGSSECPAD